MNTTKWISCFDAASVALVALIAQRKRANDDADVAEGGTESALVVEAQSGYRSAANEKEPGQCGFHRSVLTKASSNQHHAEGKENETEGQEVHGGLSGGERGFALEATEHFNRPLVLATPGVNCSGDEAGLRKGLVEIPTNKPLAARVRQEAVAGTADQKRFGIERVLHWRAQLEVDELVALRLEGSQQGCTTCIWVLSPTHLKQTASALGDVEVLHLGRLLALKLREERALDDLEVHQPGLRNLTLCASLRVGPEPLRNRLRLNFAELGNLTGSAKGLNDVG